MDPSERMVFAVNVEALAGHRPDERPHAFYMKERRIGIQEILDRWDGDDHAYLKLRADDGFTYILRYDRGRAEWEVTLVDRRLI